MKFKTTAIAMAVAGSVAAPVAVQAGADEIYASARVGVWYKEEGVSDASGNTVDSGKGIAVRSFSSRFGARGETDLGNGLTGFGRYEWDVDFNNDADGGGEDDISVRHRYVGLKGDFGSLLVGQTYHTFYNFAVGPTDIPWWHSGYAMVNYRGRTDNAITYAGGSGAIAFGVSAYFDDDSEETDPDYLEAGISFDIGDMTLGAAWQGSGDDTLGQGSTGTDDDIIGLVLSGVSFGDVSMGFGLQSQDKDNSFLAHVDIGNFYVHVELLHLDGPDQDPTALTLGYTQSLGRKTTMYYEAFVKDNDTGNSDDDVTHLMAVLKYDII